MRNYLIRAALTVRLETSDVSADVIHRYEVRLRGLGDLDSYPCPVCFVRGEDRPLMLRLGGVWIDLATCAKCNGKWPVPVPKE